MSLNGDRLRPIPASPLLEHIQPVASCTGSAILEIFEGRLVSDLMQSTLRTLYIMVMDQ